MARTFTASGIVLKRSNVGEYDRMVTILTREFGKRIVVAKGVRKLTSSRSAVLEPGNYIKALFVETKSAPILTQAMLIQGVAGMPQSLSRYRNVSQMLEIFEKLFVEEALDDSVFDHVLDLRQRVLFAEGGATLIRQQFGSLIEMLGFQHPDESEYATISDYLEALLAQPLRSFEFLRVG